MNYGYIRVSSDKQTVENQRFEILNFCRREGITVDGWIEETVSGTKAYDKRQLGRLLGKVKKRRSYHLFRIVAPWQEFVYDNGNSQPLHDKRVPCVDDKG